MSSTLYWWPKPTNRKPLESVALKNILANRLDLYHCDEVTIDNSLLNFVDGLVAAGVPDADELRDALEKHDEIVLTLQ